MSQNLKKAFSEHRRIRLAQQRANRFDQKIKVSYGNQTPGRADVQTNSSLPQNPSLRNSQINNSFEGTASATTHPTPPLKRKDPERDTNHQQHTLETENPYPTAQTHTQEIGAKTNQTFTVFGSNPHKKPKLGEGHMACLPYTQNRGGGGAFPYITSNKSTTTKNSIDQIGRRYMKLGKIQAEKYKIMHPLHTQNPRKTTTTT
ncbi:hypothetical protein CHS0354_029619 [Potamilus streckersoni]|uniref:Uncharacterized protein n=1 Tax=Potamilus streckersoni TaxID=2493646 RepID=A0AAE0VIY5_9BIVA|nr:hypothetical protein CHS0354_029619 [Potamilus streckersoni]